MLSRTPHRQDVPISSPIHFVSMDVVCPYHPRSRLQCPHRTLPRPRRSSDKDCRYLHHPHRPTATRPQGNRSRNSPPLSNVSTSQALQYMVFTIFILFIRVKLYLVILI